MLSIIVVSYNTEDILKNALQRVYEQDTYEDFEVIVVDNASSDDSCEMVRREFPQVQLICHDSNDGFAAGNNIGIQYAKGDYILLLNSDAYVFDDTFKLTVDYMDNNPSVGIMGAQLVCEDGSPQPSARDFPNPWQKFRVMTGLDARNPSYETFFDYYKADGQVSPAARKVGWVPGTYFTIRRAVIDQIGLLDDLFFMYFEEVDFCYRAKQAGWDIAFNPAITVIHLGGQSSLTTNKHVSTRGRQMIDIRVNSEYDYYKKHLGRRTMLLAAGIELFWKGLVWVKNTILRGKHWKAKATEAALAVELVWKKMWIEFKLVLR